MISRLTSDVTVMQELLTSGSLTFAADFGEAVASKEDACHEAEGFRADPQFLVHREGGKADVHAVEVGDEIANDKEGKQPAAHFARSGGKRLIIHRRIPKRPCADLRRHD